MPWRELGVPWASQGVLWLQRWALPRYELQQTRLRFESWIRRAILSVKGIWNERRENLDSAEKILEGVRVFPLKQLTGSCYCQLATDCSLWSKLDSNPSKSGNLQDPDFKWEYFRGTISTLRFRSVVSSFMLAQFLSPRQICYAREKGILLFARAQFFSLKALDFKAPKMAN